MADPVKRYENAKQASPREKDDGPNFAALYDEVFGTTFNKRISKAKQKIVKQKKPKKPKQRDPEM